MKILVRRTVNPVTSVAFSPDGRYALFRCDDGSLNQWNFSTGAEIKITTFAGHNCRVQSAAISPDGKYALSGCWDGTKIWEIRTGEEIKSIKGHLSCVTSVVISHDIRYALSISADRKSFGGKLIFWDLNTGEEIRTFPEDEEARRVTSVAISPDGKYALSGSADATLRLWDIGTGTEIRSFTSDAVYVTSVAISPDGNYALSGSADATLELWDIGTGTKIRSFTGYLERINFKRVSSDGCYSLGDNGEMKLWGLNTGAEVITLAESGRWNSQAISPNGRYKLLCPCFSSDNQDRSFKLRELSTGTERTFPGHLSCVTSVAFSPDSRYALSGSMDRTVKLWNIDNHSKPLKTFNEHAGFVTCVAFTSYPNIVLSGGNEGTILLWDIDAGKWLVKLIYFTDGTWAVVDPDGRFDTNNLEEIKGLHWIMPDDPLKPLPIEIFMRDYYEPRLLPRILAGEKFKPVRALQDLNRVQPEVKIRKIESQKDSPDAVTVTVEVSSITGEYLRNGKLAQSGMYDIRLFRDGQLVGYAPEKDGEINADEKTERTTVKVDKVDKIARKATVIFRDIKLPRKKDVKQVEFSAYAFNINSVKSTTYRKPYELPKELTPVKGRAYIITVGVNAYENPSWDLQYAANDAIRLQQVMAEKLIKSGEYEEVVQVQLISDYKIQDGKRVLIENEATKKNLKLVLGMLAGKKDNPLSTTGNDDNPLAPFSKGESPAPQSPPVKGGEVKGTAVPLVGKSADGEVSDKPSPLAGEGKGEGAIPDIPNLDKIKPARPEDLLLISFSSHCDARDGKFYFFPYDIGKGEGKEVTSELLGHAISSGELSLWLRDVDAGDMAMIVDACHSAASVEGEGFKPGPMGSRGLGQLAFDKGMKILAASQADKVAYEDPRIEQGLLTCALVKDGIELGQADFKPKDKTITLSEWLEYGVERVPKLYEEVKVNSIQDFGVATAGRGTVVHMNKNESSFRKKNAFQQPSLFDFTKKKSDVVITRETGL